MFHMDLPDYELRVYQSFPGLRCSLSSSLIILIQYLLPQFVSCQKVSEKSAFTYYAEFGFFARRGAGISLITHSNLRLCVAEIYVIRKEICIRNKHNTYI